MTLDGSREAPSLLSVPRITTLLASLFVALSSGTNYVYSAYAPQLGARLHISHTQLNIVGLAGNIGVYSSGPVWGRIADTRGPRILLACGFLFLLGGYSGMRHMYDAGLPAGSATLPTWGVCLLVACSYMTGAGGNGGLTSGLNSTAKSFPDQLRATTTGIVISGFGLSAFLFSTLAHVAFAENTSAFLLLLAVGTSCPMVAGFFLVRPIPLSEEFGRVELQDEEEVEEVHSEPNDRGVLLQNDADEHWEGEDGDHWEGVEEGQGNWGAQQVFRHANTSRSPLLQHDAGYYGHAKTRPLVSPYANTTDEEGALEPNPSREVSPETPRLRLVAGSLENCSPETGGRIALVSPEPPYLRSSSRDLHPKQQEEEEEVYHSALPNIYGSQLWSNGDFWLLFSILSMLSGTGLMYINNVGAMSQALYAKDNSAFDPAEAARWQSAQVSAISLMNFAGRIFIGLVSDYNKSRHGLPRSYCLALVSIFFFFSQLTASLIEDVRHLWIASALLGLAHGSTFSLFPTVCIEWFGLSHFSENWGYLSISPMVAGNFFSIFFGRNLDAHEAAPNTPAPFAATPSLFTSPQCLQGRECYVATLHLTTAAAVLCFALSVWAGWRDRRKITARDAMGRIKLGQEEAGEEGPWEEA